MMSRGVKGVAFSPDGTCLASGSGRWPYAVGEADNTVRLWDVSTGQELAVLRGHEGTVWWVAFSPDGTRLASASGDATVHIWDTSAGDELATLRDHEGAVVSVAFSPDGARLASGGADRTVRVRDTVPCRVRHQERQAILAARPEAKRIVDDLWQRLNDWKSVAKRLHEDASLSEPLRRAALNLLLGKSALLQEHVNSLYGQLVFVDDVVAGLEADAELDPDMRRSAIARARARGDEPHRVNCDSWNLVHFAGGDRASYEIGLRGAQAAVAAQPDNHAFLNTLGVAQYRTDRYEETFATLTRSDELGRQQGLRSRPCALAVLVMALVELERIDKARVMFQRLDDLVGYDEREGDEEASALFEEARQLLEGAALRPIQQLALKKVRSDRHDGHRHGSSGTITGTFTGTPPEFLVLLYY